MNLILLNRWRLLTLIGSLAVSLAASAIPRVDIAPAPDWRLPVKPGGRVPSARDYTEGYYNALVDLQTHVERRELYTHIIREIRTTEGVQNGSQISVYVNPAYEQLTFHAVTLYRAGQANQKLRAGAFKIVPVEAERDRFIYNDTYAATLLLDDVRPGDRIEYDFTITGTNPVLGNRFTSEFYFSSSDLLPHRHQVLLVGTGRKLAFRNYNNPTKARVWEQNGLKVYEWDVYNLKSPISEPHAPDWNSIEAHVQVSEYGSWQDVINWALPMYTVRPPTSDLLPLIADWKRQSAGNPLKYAQLAITFVQNDVRYMGIEIGENSHRPHDPAQVLRQRYGDCKDKSLLLCTLLQANQIEAHPALTNTYTGTQTNQLLPSPVVFNHAIVRMRPGGKTYWVDPTLSHQRSVDGEFNMPLYGTALVLRPGETGLQSITSPRRGSINITETFVVPSPRTTQGTGKLHVLSIYSFNHADNMRSEVASSSLATLEKSYLNFYQSNYNQCGVELLDSLRIDDDVLSNVVTSHEGYSITNGWQTDSASGLATFEVFGRSFYENFRQLPAQKRHQPVALGFPYEMDYTIRLELPETWTATDETWTVKRAAYELSFSRFYNPADSSISLQYHYKSLANHLAPDAVDTYRADVKKITDQLQYQLTYNANMATQEGKTHPGSVVFFLLVLIGFGYLGWRWYQYAPDNGSTSPEAQAIGGWLVFMAIGVLVTPLIFLQQLLTSSVYTDAGTWSMLTNAPSTRIAWLQVCVYGEGVMNVFFLCFSGLCAILFIQRRSTFPRLYSVFLAARAAFLLADAVIVGLFVDTPTDSEIVSDIVRAMVAAAIWIPYLHTSSRVRQTFVRSLTGNAPDMNETEVSAAAETETDGMPAESKPQTLA